MSLSITFSHVGIFATDVNRVADFYQRVLRFVESDRGKTTYSGADIVFMTRDPSEHHQLVVAAGRPADLKFSTINQISFRLDSLRSMRELHERLKQEADVKILGPVTHGNAVSLYFQDPEGNRVECLIDTPWHVPQPYRVAVDLSQPDDEIWAKIEKDARATPGFKPINEWKAEIRSKIERATNRPAART